MIPAQIAGWNPRDAYRNLVSAMRDRHSSARATRPQSPTAKGAKRPQSFTLCFTPDASMSSMLYADWYGNQ